MSPDQKVKGFGSLDLSTSFASDLKFRLLSRRHPAQTAAAIAAWIILVAESWRDGSRLTLEESWQHFPYDEKAVAALRDVGLVDGEARIPADVWERHFGEACKRREKARDRQQRADAKRARPGPSSPAPAPVPVPVPVPVPDLSQRGSNVGPTLDERTPRTFEQWRTGEQARREAIEDERNRIAYLEEKAKEVAG